jgi:uncharacterized cupredoxin-like copper-binding protein
MRSKLKSEGEQVKSKTAFLVALLTAGALLAGCGGSGGGTTTQAQTPSSGVASGKTLQIIMDDYTFSPSDAAAKAASVTISAPNNGQVVHELVLAKTDADPGALPTTADGEVDEAKLEARGEDAGEIADVEAGDTKEGTFKLTPGRYVMFCNIPGHYAQGMYGTLTVK